MNVNKVVDELGRLYPGSHIKVLPPGDAATEIVCELQHEPDAESSRAIAVIDGSVPHFHRHTVEHYKVMRGSLKLHAAGVVHVLNEGDEFNITPNTVHSAQGNETWVEVVCHPPYSQADHIIVTP